MQTHFSLAQLADPATARAEKILRACVHCGFCTATCPTYKILGDELDSPRGRIYLIKHMLENEEPADRRVATHIDRCLSCLSCMTTCPSGVHYMHLVDHARAHIEKTYERPFLDRWLRAILAFLVPHPGRFRLALLASWPVKPLAPLLPKKGHWGRLRAMLELTPMSGPAAPSVMDDPGVHPAKGERRMRVALMTGCAQRALDASINEATIRLLTRLGCEVVIADGAGCCGSLTHHLGMEKRAHAQAKANVVAWRAAEARYGTLDAIVSNASGCGTTLKDYAVMLEGEPELAQDAARTAALARDLSEVVERLGFEPVRGAHDRRAAYHSACSMQHGQKLKSGPPSLLRKAGFQVAEPKNKHLCCGSAGVYNVLQPEIAAKLGADKAATLNALDAEIVVTGNIGCMTQLAGSCRAPVVHLAHALDWATGGPEIAANSGRA